MLSVMPEACQHFFKFFTKFIPEPVFAGQRPTPQPNAEGEKASESPRINEWPRHVKSLGLTVR
jgi:hypothetical protein